MRSLLLAAAIVAAPAGAATLTAQGVFSAEAPTNAFLAPGRAWSFTADVPNVVTPGAYAPIAALAVRLDGVAVAVDQPEAAFFTTDDFGLFGVRFRRGDERYGWDMAGAQAFGPGGALIRGTYAVNLEVSGAFREVLRPQGWWDGRDRDPFAPGQTVRIATPVPEPGTWALMIVGFGLIGTAARASRRSAASG